MTKPQAQATTLPLTVKVVRGAATASINFQRRKLDDKLRRIVAAYNADVEAYNASRLTRWLNRSHRTVLDVEATIENWKKLWIAGEMRGDHLAYEVLWISRTGWWQRLRQLETLPVADDDKVMQVSVEDLDLIDYNIWMQEQKA